MIYTRKGDEGETGLPGGGRVRKDDPRIVACGEIDELSSSIGTAISMLPRRRAFWSLRLTLEAAQSDLLRIGTELAASGKPAPPHTFSPEATAKLEAEIDRLTGDLRPLRQFILPGGSAPGSFLHLSRAVCRRAERAVCALSAGLAAPPVLSYLNRLSDLLFVSARWANHRMKQHEARWKAPR
ncbi:cob(I)yrinic acid a,c-diamide adenosyltransferase [Elusimicrobiota bacterium]